MSSITERKRHLPADQRRAATVKAVVDLASTQDPGTITTGAIASHMGLTQGAVFRHFPSKDAIWEAVLGWAGERLLARLGKAARRSPSPLAGLQAMFLAHAEFAARHPGVPRILVGELQRAGDTPAKRAARVLLQRYGELIRERIEAGKSCGELHAELDTDSATTLFIGSIQGLFVQSLLTGDPGRIRRQAPGAFAIYRRGIARST